MKVNRCMDEKNLIKSILLAFEQSSTTIKYHKIYEYDDGPNDIKQITLSFGITEYGNLRDFIKSYINSGGINAEFFKAYVDRIGRVSLISDQQFKQKLIESAKDPIMKKCQDDAFDQMYITPAYKWASDKMFILPLSRLVISDSYLHSGSILKFLRNKFPERVPSEGGDEKTWIAQYCQQRSEWLKYNVNPILRNTTYRMNFMFSRISDDDWNLTKPPYDANGVQVI